MAWAAGVPTAQPLVTPPLASAFGELEAEAYTGVWFGPWPRSWLSKHWKEERRVF